MYVIGFGVDPRHCANSNPANADVDGTYVNIILSNHIVCWGLIQLLAPHR
jgi:hypothetical protein